MAGWQGKHRTTRHLKVAGITCREQVFTPRFDLENSLLQIGTSQKLTLTQGSFQSEVHTS